MKVVRYYPRALAGDGGITASVRSSAEAMVGLGAEVTVLYEGSPGADPSVRGGVPFVPVGHAPGAHVPLDLKPWLADADVMVTHSAWTGFNLVATAAAHRIGVPYILEPRGAYDPHIVSRRRVTKSVWWRIGERRMVHRAAAVHIFFPAEEAHLSRLGYTGPAVTVPNGVKVPDGHRWDGGSGGYMLWLGRFDPEHKGLDLLLQALSRLPARRRPQLRLHGPDWRAHKRVVAGLVEDLGLAASVEIGEPLYGDAKFEAMSAARAFVYPSRWEAFGNSVAEAAALGVPVLTTRYPLGCFLQQRGAALTCDAAAEDLAGAIERVLDAGAAEMGARARQVVEAEFRWEAVARSWLEQVEAVL